MRNFKFTLAYDGTDFHGWQVQPGRPTIQAALADALRRITGETVLPQGSGRTDAGVHALAQVASCALASSIPAANLVVALNDILPPAIRVMQVEEAPPEFHARKSARAKTYRYRIYRGDICPPLLARYVYHHPYPLDENAICAAADGVTGEHDFTSFAAVDAEKREELRGADSDSGHTGQRPVPHTDKRSNVRTIFVSQWQRAGEELIYTVRGSGFLHHMVRNLVGTFLLVGKGSLQPADLARILQARNRSANPGATAPASGLYLVGVEYG
jgi:tRNA pseudouridine38-40 synthase